jgi:membrane associated rhomboid family serine protease
MLPLKDVVAPQRFPRVSASILAAGVVATPLLWWTSVIDTAAALFAGVQLLYLCVFADNVEDRLGPRRFVGLYALAHAAGTGAALTFAPGADVALGITSGAVGGILGAYVVLYPDSRVLMFVPLPLDLYEAPALVIVASYFVLHATAGVPGLAQVGAGFVTGAAACLALRRPVRW